MSLTSDILKTICDDLRTALTATYGPLFITVVDAPTPTIETTPGIQLMPVTTEQNADRNGFGLMRFVFRVTGWTQTMLDPADQAYKMLAGTLSPQALCESVAQRLNNTIPSGAAGPIAKRTGPTAVTIDKRSGMAKAESEFWMWLEETWTA